MGRRTIRRLHSSRKQAEARLAELGVALVLYGSDISDGNVHLSENLPMLLCGGGADLKFGHEVGSPTARRPLSDLHVAIASLLNVTSITSLGSGVCASTGQPLGIRV